MKWCGKPLPPSIGKSGVDFNNTLLDARMVKACRRFGQWEAVNCKKKRLKLFSKMKTGLKVIPRPEQHT
ncbi:MAG: hypothetical protein ACFNZW_07430 [Coriobacteriaceae bacterium]